MMFCYICLVTIAPSSFADHVDRNEVEEFTTPTCEKVLETLIKPENEPLKKSDQDQNYFYTALNCENQVNTSENDGNLESSKPVPEPDMFFPEAGLPDLMEKPEQVFFLELLGPEIEIEESTIYICSDYSDFDAGESKQAFVEENDISDFTAFHQINTREPEPEDLINIELFSEETFTVETASISHLTEVRTIFEISKAEDFQLARDNPTDYFVITANINLANSEPWVPVGTSDKPFKGNFDGQGFTISGLFSNQTESYLGLFGYTSGATLENIQLETVDLKGSEYVGGLVGLAINTTIRNCSVGGEIAGNGDYVGGLVGKADKSTITDSSSSVVVSGKKGKVGGLVGFAFKSHIINTAAIGTVTGQGNMVGGLIGQVQSSTITTSYADTIVTGTALSSGVGGLAGMLTQNSGIYNSYATGVVSGGTHVGSLVGEASAGDEIKNSYASVEVSSKNDNICRLFGHHSLSTTITSSYWDMKVYGNDSSTGGAARTTEEMKKQENYIGWDFIDTWFIEEGQSYPLLQWQLIATEPVVPTEPPAQPPVGDYTPIPPGGPGNPGKPDYPAAPRNLFFANPGNMFSDPTLSQGLGLPGYHYASIRLKPQHSGANYNSSLTLNFSNLIYYYLEQAELIIEALENGELTATDKVLTDLDSYYYWAELYFLIYQQRYGLFEATNIEERLAQIRRSIEKYHAH